jgi:hypothetical protein
MSIKVVGDILKKAHEDEGFKDSLLNDPESTLKEFDLTDDERSRFMSLDGKKLAMFQRNIDKRFMKDGSEGEGNWWVDSVTD